MRKLRIYGQDPWRSIQAIVIASLAATCLWWASVAGAHGSGHATLKITRTSPAHWSFELQAPLSVIDQSMRASNKQQAIEIGDVDPRSKRHKELLVEYVKKTFDASVVASDSAPQSTGIPQLGKGRIRLGEHVSIFHFEIHHLPESPGLITFQLPYMEDVSGQQNVLTLIDDKRIERFFLSSHNDFSLVGSNFYQREK